MKTNTGDEQMDKKKNGIPKLRFPGFTGAWEQRKLNNFLETSRAKNLRNDYSKEDVLSVSGEYGIVNQIKFQGRSFAGESVLKYGIVETGDIVYTKSPLKHNPYGIIKVNRGNNGIVSTLYAVYKTKKDINPFFIECYFDDDYRLNTYLKPLVNKGAKNDMKVSDNNALVGQVIFPLSYSEQTLISSFFDQINNLIALHQRKIDHLKEQKTGLLQKLFPKKGEVVPEVRFPGFTDAWEQRRLGEVVERFDNLRIPVTSSKREKGITPYYGANGIQDYVQGYTHDGEFVLVAEDGANDLQNYPVHYVNGKVWVNNHAHVLQGKNKMVDNLFLVNAIKQIKIETYLVGGSRAKLNADVMMKLPIKVPTFNEQQKIGEYFSKFDTLIALHQRKLDHLQLLKKGLLQQMFV